MPVDRVNMAKIPANATPPCIQAQTIPIQDTVLSTGHIVLLQDNSPVHMAYHVDRSLLLST